MAATASAGPFLGGADEKARRHIVTPEGVALPVELAGRSERAAAFLIDMAVVGGCLLAIGLLGILSLFAVARGQDRQVTKWAWVFLLLLWFLVRSFYFAFFELRWQGRTPGKRALHLRVIDRAGGALRADAVIARNLMREVEVFLPITLMLVGPATDLNGWIALAMLGWVLIFTFMPLFNRDRLRVGDMVGGTWVIRAPKAVLLPDLAADAGAAAAAPAPGPYRFSAEQLDAYGIYELQVLEGVLRGTGPGHDQALVAVAAKIRTRIGWAGGEPPEEFLRRYYAALRARLEGKLLLGKRRADKHHAGR
jgi:uncharacterized RDD family membrane protein YckC